MNFDFQISEGVLMEALRINVERQLLVQDLGVGGIMDIPFNLFSSGVEPGVLNHMTVSAVTLSRTPGSIAPADTVTIMLPPRRWRPLGEPNIRSVLVEPILIRVLIDLHCVRLSDLLLAGGNPVPTEQLVIFQMRANFTLAPPEIFENSLRLFVRIASIEVGMGGVFPDPSRFPEPEGTALRTIVNRLNTPASLSRIASIPPIVISFAGISNELGPDFRLWNAGINFNPGVLTIRMQFDRIELIEDTMERISTEWFSDWYSFYFLSLTSIVSRLNGAGWALFFPSLFFQRRVETTIVEALAGNPQFVLNPDNMPYAVWSIIGGMPTILSPCIPGGQAEILTRFSASARGVCIPFGFDIDVNCSIRLQFSLPRSGIIRAEMHLDFTPDVGDAALCSITNSLLASAAGFVIGGTFGGYPVAAIGAAIFGVAAGVGTLSAIYLEGPDSFETDTILPVEGSDRDYYTELALPIPNDPFLGIFTSTALNACMDGLAVTGSITPSVNTFSLLGTLSQDEGFRWKALDNVCPPPPLTPRIIGFSELIWTRGPGRNNFPTVYYNIAILESMPEGYTSTSIRILPNLSLGRIYFEIDESYARLLRDRAVEEGLELPGFRLLLQTNRGARLIFVRGSDGELSDIALRDLEEITRIRCDLRREAMEELKRRASELLVFLRPVTPFHEFDPIDVREWIITASGFQPNEVLRIGRNLSKNNQNIELSPIIEVSPNENGLVAFHFWEEMNPAFEALLMDIKSHMTILSGNSGQVFVGCKQYEYTASIRVYGEYRDHAFFRRGNMIQLAILTSLGVSVYGVSNPISPHLVTAIQLKGLQLIRSTQQGGFVLWNETESWWLNENGVKKRIINEKNPVLLAGIKYGNATGIIQGQTPTVKRIGELSALISENEQYIKLCRYLRFDSN